MVDYIVGIDEAGRGPLAGPLAIGVAMVPADCDLRAAFPTLTDSKKLSEAQREELYQQLRGPTSQEFAELRGRTSQFATTFMQPATIDRDGMTACLSRGVARLLAKLGVSPADTFIKLDGNLSAPREFGQETITKGDVSEPAISAASIMAKVERDRRMVRYGARWPEYGFERHKGYGTQAHREAIRRYGACGIHRRRFLRRIK